LIVQRSSELSPPKARSQSSTVFSKTSTASRLASLQSTSVSSLVYRTGSQTF
ncbi:unnamed protein product, partial [Brassica rapa]